MITDALRIDSATTKTAPLERRIRFLTGAHSLSDAIPSLSEIGSMGGSAVYDAVALRARKVLLQESLPSIEQRKSRIIEVVEMLRNDSGGVPSEVIEFVCENVPLSDVFYPLLNDFSSESERLALAELHMRKVYQAHTIKEFSREIENGQIKFTLMSKASESLFSTSTLVSSMTDLTRALSHSSIQKLGELSDIDSDRNFLRVSQSDHITPKTPQTVVCKLVQTMDELKKNETLEKTLSSFPQYSDDTPKNNAPINVLYIIMNQGCHEI